MKRSSQPLGALPFKKARQHANGATSDAAVVPASSTSHVVPRSSLPTSPSPSSAPALPPSSPRSDDLQVIVKLSARAAGKRRERSAVQLDQPGKPPTVAFKPPVKTATTGDIKINRRPDGRFLQQVVEGATSRGFSARPAAGSGQQLETDAFVLPASPPRPAASPGFPRIDPSNDEPWLPSSPDWATFDQEPTKRSRPTYIATPPSKRVIAPVARARAPAAASSVARAYVPRSPEFVPSSPEFVPSSPPVCLAYERVSSAGLEPPAHLSSEPVPVTSDDPLLSDATAPKEGILSLEQMKVHNLVVKDGLSLFFTGSAGTGKSFLLQHIIASLKVKHPHYGAVAVTASTGIAGCHIGGTTVHSFASIGLGQKPVNDLIKDISGAEKKRDKWLAVKVWIIDEISMLDGGLFDKLSEIASAIRKDRRPFGGIQMVICGDFLQLPPVSKRGEKPVFAFESATWPQALQRTVMLTNVFRQKDATFVHMLNEMRAGTVSAATTQRLQSLSRQVRYEDGVEPTELMPLRSQVDQSNARRLKALPGPVQRFEAYDSGVLRGENRDRILASFMAPATLELKVGAQVMLIKNWPDHGLHNGSVGVVVGFEETYPLVAFAGRPNDPARSVAVLPVTFSVENPRGETLASRTQVPLIPAWAMSIHKSQGQTLERVKIDLSRVFDQGQAYVGLSRATNLDALQVIGFTPQKVRCHPRVLAWSAKHLETL